METTSIKVPVDLRNRIAELASRQHRTLAATIAHALDIADEAEFWNGVRETMPTTVRIEDSAAFERTLSDGLDPAEDWGDLL